MAKESTYKLQHAYPTIVDKAKHASHDGKLIEYTIVRSRRRKKTIEITLDPQDRRHRALTGTNPASGI